jgi:hypothetical protein
MAVPIRRLISALYRRVVTYRHACQGGKSRRMPAMTTPCAAGARARLTQCRAVALAALGRELVDPLGAIHAAPLSTGATRWRARRASRSPGRRRQGRRPVAQHLDGAVELAEEPRECDGAAAVIAARHLPGVGGRGARERGARRQQPASSSALARMAARSAVGPGDAARPCANWLGRIDSTPKVRAIASSTSAGARATSTPPPRPIAAQRTRR